MGSSLVVSFMHSNYMINSYGTEKFVRELSQTLQEKEYNHLCFFSFFHEYGKKAIGINYNDRFEGVYKYCSIPDLINSYLANNQLNLVAIHFHNFLNHDLGFQAEIVNRYKVPCYVFVHDFYIVCNQFKLINSKGNFCGISMPTQEKCAICNYKKSAIAHASRISRFLKDISENLTGIICPSEYVKLGITRVFPQYKDLIYTRPHLQFGGHFVREESSETIRLAYAGLQVADKGFDEWKELVKLVNEKQNGKQKKYKFYYLGTGKEKVNGVTNVYVSTAEQGEKAMLDAVRNHRIDIVLLWTMCPETYSYVYYEMSCGGVFVITNKKSGNISVEVKNRGNGIVFDKFEECLEFVEDYTGLRKSILQLRADANSFIPLTMKKNTDLSNIIPVDIRDIYVPNYHKSVHPRKNRVKTILYKIKHRGIINV